MNQHHHAQINSKIYAGPWKVPNEPGTFLLANIKTYPRADHNTSKKIIDIRLKGFPVSKSGKCKHENE